MVLAQVTTRAEGGEQMSRWRDLQIDRGGSAFSEKEEREEMRRSTSDVESLIDNLCVPAKMVETSGTGARGGFAITGATTETLLGVMILTLSGSTLCDRATRRRWRTTKNARRERIARVVNEGIVINRGGLIL
jgi:hypothetical protein